MSERIAELRRLIDQADVAYYTKGSSTIEDTLYDRWKEELAQLSPGDPRIRRIGASVQSSILQKRKHRIPMGSQSKVTNQEEYRKWVQTIGKDETLHASYKMDGGSFSFEYEEGRLVCAVSRGDGEEGEDITANALRFQGLPVACRTTSGQPFTGFVRGEVVIHTDDWEQVDPDMLKNPRNVAVGIARRKDGEDSERLTVYAFRLFDSDGDVLGKTEEDQSVLLKQMGFNIAPYTVGTADSVWQWFQMTHEIRPKLPYWIDGLVLKANDVARQTALGATDGRPKGQVALKFEAEEAVTVLRKCEIGCGHTGAVVPVGIFDPVEIGGTTVSCATLCNWDNIRELNLGVGDTIRVIKAGDIIPRIMEVTGKAPDSGTIPEPSHCPECGGPVGHRSNVSGEDSAIIYCLNPDCPAKLFGKIQRFLRSIGVVGGGEQLIKALIQQLNVTDAADLYRLHQRREALASLKSGKTKFGQSRADKFLAEIEKSRKLTLAQFLGSLGIFGLGKRRVKLVQEAVPGEMDRLEDWLSGKLLILAKQAGVPNIAQRISNEIAGQSLLINKFIEAGLEIVNPTPKPVVKEGAFTICITGELSQPKAHFWKLIADCGHVGTDDFTKSVTHLVAADPNGSSTKLQKARKRGIPVLSEQELLELLDKSKSS